MSIIKKLLDTSQDYQEKKKIKRNWITVGIDHATNDMLEEMKLKYKLPKTLTLQLIIKSAYEEVKKGE